MANEAIEITARLARNMAWERAKGEMRSMLHTFWGDTSSENQFDKFDAKMEEFITDIEDNGLHE
jgi:hypothetical protein